jgi:hypothetical protein
MQIRLRDMLTERSSSSSSSHKNCPDMGSRSGSEFGTSPSVSGAPPTSGSGRGSTPDSSPAAA